MGATMPRPFRYVWLIGFVLTVASAGGAAWMLHQPVQEGSSDSTAASAPPARGGNGKSVTCTGFADTKTGLQLLNPPQPGRVVEVLVCETQEVTKDQPLLRLDDRHAKEQLVQAQNAVRAAKAQVAQAETGPRRKEISIAQQNQAIKAVQQNLLAARRVLKDLKELKAVNGARDASLDEAQYKINGLEAQEQVERQKLEAIEIVDPVQELERAKADLGVKESLLEEARQALDECTYKAPADGTVIRLLVHAGDLVSPQAPRPAVQFLPKEDQIIRAEVEQEWESRIEEGMPAIIEDDTTTGKKWHGKVYRKAFVYQPRRTISQETFQLNDVRTLECLISLDPGQPPFRVHQKVRVIIGAAK